MSDPLLVQYQVLSGQRLHFGRLYWQSIAFLFALLLGAAAAFKGTSLVPYSMTLVGFGAITALMGFVAERLRKLESRYEDLLEHIERSLQKAGHSEIQIAPKSGPRGARFVITMGLFVLGAALILLGLAQLAGPANL